jgi:hypothetical protein
MFLAPLLLAASFLQAAPYTISADGLEVTDQATGLVWRRCAEGMSLIRGVCGGLIAPLSHENALMHATSVASSSGKAWRLPNLKELSSLADRSGALPAIDSLAFPGTAVIDNASSWFWSSTPDTAFPGTAKIVDFRTGRVSGGGLSRSSAIAVRLVRDGP